MKNMKLSFCIEEMPLFAVAHRAGRKTLEFQMYDGALTCSVMYDYARQPLDLNAEVQLGDKVDLILMPHRIELYVNGALIDEEWPSGNRLFAPDDAFFPEFAIEIAPYEEEKKEIPCVLGEFTNAEGWYPGGGVFVGDCMPYRKDDEYHVLYLKDRHHHRSKWGLGAHQWDHISTKDFVTWQIHPMAVPLTDPAEGSVCTGSWIRNGEKEYLFYTIRMGSGLPAPIRRSVSTDGYHFERDADFGFVLGEAYSASNSRDPKVVLGEDGLFHMFITTRLSKEQKYKGCLAHFISEDLNTWTDTGKPIYVSDDMTEPECPDYFSFGGKYYLIFSLHGKAHYQISDRPFDGFEEPKNPIIPCESVPKGAIWGDEIIFTGFKRMSGYAGAMTFKKASAGPSGELIFETAKK